MGRPRPLPLFLDLVHRETAGDADYLGQVLAGLRRYQTAQRPPPMAEGRRTIARSGSAQLVARGVRSNRRRRGANTPPVVLIPSIINSHDILDLCAEASFMQHLDAAGFDTLLLDWGSPLREGPGAALSIDDLVQQRLVPLLKRLAQPPVLIGYCLGGPIALAACALMPVRALVTLAAPWHFAGYPDTFDDGIAATRDQATAAIDRWNMVPIEMLQHGFWTLDSAATVRKFARFASMPENDPDARLFVAVEDWANGGEPIAGPAARQLFDDFFRDDLPGRNLWRIGDTVIRPDRVACPMLHVSSTTDRIVPHAARIRVGDALGLSLGHVGMMIGRRARTALWEPVSAWISDQLRV